MGRLWSYVQDERAKGHFPTSRSIRTGANISFEGQKVANAKVEDCAKLAIDRGYLVDEILPQEQQQGRRKSCLTPGKNPSDDKPKG